MNDLAYQVMAEILIEVRRIANSLEDRQQFNRVRVGELVERTGMSKARMDGVLAGLGIARTKINGQWTISNEDAQRLRHHLSNPSMAERLMRRKNAKDRQPTMVEKYEPPTGRSTKNLDWRKKYGSSHDVQRSFGAGAEEGEGDGGEGESDGGA